MRPTKLTSNLLEAFRAVLADELAAIAFTEEELVWQANQRLRPDDQISYRTYQRYKADILYREENGELSQPIATAAPDPANDQNTELVGQMYATFRNAMLKQKLALVRGIYEGQPNWRRYTWMLERKFPDFKMKTIVPATTKAVSEAKPVTQAKPTLSDAIPERLKNIYKVPERMEDKWQDTIPMKPFGADKYWTLDADVLYSIEENIARFEGLGMENPYKHLGYREDEYREGGQYRFYGMGPDRLPLRVYRPEGETFPELADEEKERLWEIQEAENEEADAA